MEILHFNIVGSSSLKSQSKKISVVENFSRCYGNFKSLSRSLISERRILRWSVLSGPPGQHNSIRALHARDTATWRLFGNGGTTVVGMGQIREHGALCLSEYADPGIRCRRANHVSNNFQPRDTIEFFLEEVNWNYGNKHSLLSEALLII